MGHLLKTQTQLYSDSQILSDNLSKTEFLYGGTSIPENADMAVYKTPGNYCCQQNAVAATLKSCPVDRAFYLKIKTSHPTSKESYIVQEYTVFDGSEKITVGYDPYTDKWSDPKKYIVQNDLNDRISSRLKIEWSNDPVGLLITVDRNNKRLLPSSAMTNIS